MSFVNLGEIFDHFMFADLIEIVETLPLYKHQYGQKFETPEFPVWMTYLNKDNIPLPISFTRNTHMDPRLNRMCKSIADLLKNKFAYDFDYKKIHCIKTSGMVPAHRDEGGRNCCINIGIKNSEKAITTVAKNKHETEINNINSVNFTVKDGYAYLLNTNCLHKVNQNSDVNRYLITYPFTDLFENICKLWEI